MQAGSSALAPAAHGGLPPKRYPGHRPSPAGRRHARRAYPRRDGHPPGAPVLSRAKITVKSAPACGLASFGWRCAPLWTVIFLGT